MKSVADGHQLAACDFLGKIYVWNAKTMQREYLLTPEGSSVYSVHYSPDGTNLLAISEDHSIFAWDLKDPVHPRSSLFGSFGEGKSLEPMWSAGSI